MKNYRFWIFHLQTGFKWNRLAFDFRFDTQGRDDCDEYDYAWVYYEPVKLSIMVLSFRVVTNINHINNKKVFEIYE